MLPIHVACDYNAYFVLSWMMRSDIYPNINVETRTINVNTRTQTALNIAIRRHSVECVEVLCKQQNLIISKEDIFDALTVDDSKILKNLLRALFEQHRLNDWKSIVNLKKSSLINETSIVGYRISTKKANCSQLLNNLINNGYRKCDYHYIAHMLNYNVKSVINNHIEQYSLRIEDKYNIQGKLGSGTFGQVKYAVNKQTKQKAAIKYISLKKSSASPQFVSTEIDAISKITHKNVIKLIDYDVRHSKDDMVALVFEYAPFGELYQFLSRVNYFNFHVRVC